MPYSSEELARYHLHDRNKDSTVQPPLYIVTDSSALVRYLLSPIEVSSGHDAGSEVGVNIQRMTRLKTIREMPSNMCNL